MTNDSDRHHTSISRRRFLETTVGAAALVVPLSAFRPMRPRRAAGVEIGIITYSYRQLPGGAEEILGWLTGAGLSTVELMGDVAETYAGAPAPPPFPRNFREMTDADRAAFRAAREAYATEVGAWRREASMERFEALGNMYREQGVRIDILKLGEPRWSDEEIDYAFKAAKAVGARGICFEVSKEGAERIAPFADKHEAIVALHHHTQVGAPDFSWETPLSFSPNLMINFDVGHYYAGTGKSPVEFIEQHHERISHLHLKDRNAGESGANLPWGQGETPLVEILHLLQREGYPIPAMIELEYEIPEDSDVLAEVQKCVDFCKKALG